MLLNCKDLIIKYVRLGIVEKDKENLYSNNIATLFETKSFATASNYSDIVEIFEKIKIKHPKTEVEPFKKSY